MSFFKKHKLLFDCIGLIVFVFGAILSWMDYTAPGGKNLDLVVAIVLGLSAIVYLAQVIDQVSWKRPVNSSE